MDTYTQVEDSYICSWQVGGTGKLNCMSCHSKSFGTSVCVASWSVVRLTACAVLARVLGAPLTVLALLSRKRVAHTLQKITGRLYARNPREGLPAKQALSAQQADSLPGREMPSAASLLLLGLGTAVARRFHDEKFHKHAHTYLQFCANTTFTTSHSCIHKVSAKWPQPAVLDPQECREATSPYSVVGTSHPWCAGTPELVNIYDPITIPMGLLKVQGVPVDYRKGADTDTLTDWDRIRCLDGQLFATGCAAFVSVP